MKPKENTNEEKDLGFNFNHLWMRNIVYWPYFLLLLILSLATAWVYLKYATTTYEAHAKILIKDEQKGSDDSQTMDFLSVISTKKVLENEKEVISSKTLINNVVKNLGLYAPVFEEGELKPVSAYTASPIIIEAKHPDKIENYKKIYFDFDEIENTVIIKGKKHSLNKWIRLYKDTFRFKENPRKTESKSAKFYFEISKPENIAGNIRNNIEVKPTSKTSTILNLQLKDEEPQRAVDILNELMDVYNKASLKDKNSLAANTVAFVQERLDEVALNLDSIENRMKEYKTKTGSIDIGTQGELFLRNVSDNDQRLSEINMKLAVLNQVQNYVLSKNNRAGIVPSTLGVDDPILTNLLTLLYEAELEYEKYKNTEGENSATLVAINTQIERIRPGILENIQNQKRGLDASKRNLLSTNNAYSSAIRTIPRQEKALLDINREQNIVSGIYSFLLEKREESILSYASTIPGSRIIDKAESSYFPVTPKPKRVYVLAFILPFIIGIGTITIKEAFTSKILFRQEIEDFTAYPIIGEIAYDKTKNPIGVSQTDRTFISEQFRQLRVAISMNKNKSECYRILVTSTIAGEGKSYISLNLACMFAMNNKKTVLIELDLTNPSISKYANISSTPGMSEYLQGHSEKEDIIKRTSIMENLFIIPAGFAPDRHPSELVENGRIIDLLNYLNEIFDYIIIDTAPVGAITDAYILSTFTDLTLYIIRHNYTPKIYIERLDQNNKDNRLKNPAIVFNGIHPRGFGKHNYGYGYGYGYVYNEKRKTKMVKA